MLSTLTSNLAGTIRREWRNGKEYIVAPMRMIVSGVLPGSDGPLLYPRSELKKNPSDWNLIPIVRNHPKRNGDFCSASLPGIYRKQGLGFVDGSTLTGNGTNLDAYGWFDVAKTRHLDPSIIERLERGEPLELSTGLFTKNKRAPFGATYNGRGYTYVATNYKPDHLAILTDQVGACSLNDGCGVLMANEQYTTTIEQLDRFLRQQLSKSSFHEGTNNAMSYFDDDFVGEPLGLPPTLNEMVQDTVTAKRRRAMEGLDDVHSSFAGDRNGPVEPAKRFCQACQGVTLPDDDGDCSECGRKYKTSRAYKNQFAGDDMNPIGTANALGVPTLDHAADFQARIKAAKRECQCGH